MNEDNYQKCTDYDFMAWLWEVKGIEPLLDPKPTKVRRGLMRYFYSIDDDVWIDLRTEYTRTEIPSVLKRMKLLADPSF